MKVAVCVRTPLGRDDRAALRLARGLGAAEVLALAAGAPGEDAALHAACAAGAGRAVRLADEALASANFHTLGRALAAAAKHLGADLILTGARSDDEGLGAVAGSIAEHAKASHVACIETLALRDGQSVEVAVYAGGRTQRLAVSLPAVLSVASIGADDGAPPAGPSGPGGATGQAPAIEVLGLDAIGLDASLIRRRDDLLGTVEAVPRTATEVASATALVAGLFAAPPAA